MPLIEMSEVLTDPMFLDSFSVNRRTQLVDETGIASTGSTVFPGVFGVVYPSDKNDLSRLPDFQLQSKAITVITKFALRGESKTSGDGATSFYPDLVVWNGGSYIVAVLEDYSRFASGFLLAICTSIDLVDQVPTTE